MTEHGTNTWWHSPFSSLISSLLPSDDASLPLGPAAHEADLDSASTRDTGRSADHDPPTVIHDAPERDLFRDLSFVSCLSYRSLSGDEGDEGDGYWDIDDFISVCSEGAALQMPSVCPARQEPHRLFPSPAGGERTRERPCGDAGSSDAARSSFKIPAIAIDTSDSCLALPPAEHDGYESPLSSVTVQSALPPLAASPSSPAAVPLQPRVKKMQPRRKSERQSYRAQNINGCRPPKHPAGPAPDPLFVIRGHVADRYLDACRVKQRAMGMELTSKPCFPIANMYTPRMRPLIPPTEEASPPPIELCSSSPSPVADGYLSE
ncbi:unnamed protein product [Vitrella brassicaformis CCMP3155]|uniref:Uncharacterized protein n=1 Tax=Vitrella brassicaformis (strain CCMP3155) TaxID=1169540 RepID=A0A0G4E914_VITBC|nr:unnamed protein product [Vitrella brassicaformis CCMP3155]|eukprot:CEL92014.1 unnamed protein product [Vitrella brassicaformis CCMP3155]